MFNRTFVLGLLLLPSLVQAQGQPRAASCFFSIDFESGIPFSWDVGPFVERQTQGGAGLGEFVPAWTVGNATQANANGFFPVPNVPTGNKFLMANDDAAPCNCDMSDVVLTTSAIDLTGRTNVALEFNYYNSDLVIGDTAIAQVSTDGSVWDTVFVMPPNNAWLTGIVDLSAYDGTPSLFLRFRWSDGGTWASGFALDNICLRERLANDLSVLWVNTHDTGISPFTFGDQTLRYRQLPLQQAGPLTPSMRIRNSGMNTATGVTASVVITQSGSEVYNMSGIELPDVPPGPGAHYHLETNWTPTEVGEVVVTMSVAIGPGDDDISDNSGTASLQITGAGWDLGYGAMSRDEGLTDGSMGGSINFIAANRMEIVNAWSTARGISTIIASGSTEGEQVRAIIMDANFAFIDTSWRHTLTAQDLEEGFYGLPLYLPFNAPPSLSQGDYFVGIQHLGSVADVRIATSGNCPVGASALMQGTTFDITWTTSTPVVRLHLEEFGVGIPDAHRSGPGQILIYPVPMSSMGQVVFELDEPSHTNLRLMDVTGRMVLQQDLGKLPPGKWTRTLDVAGIATGTYILQIGTAKGRNEKRFVISR